MELDRIYDRLKDGIENVSISGLRISKISLRWSLAFVAVAFFLLAGTGLAQEEAVEAGGTNLLKNPNFEQGWIHWQRQGGAVEAEPCCGQHETPFWGQSSASSPYPGAPLWQTHTWDGYVQPNGQFTQLFQWAPVVEGKHYRLSVWLFTNGMTANIKRFSPALNQYIFCGSTNSLTYVLVSCEFEAEATENQSMGLIGDANAPIGKWVVSDDWSLTKIVKPKRWVPMPLWATLPIKYHVANNGYITRTEIAANRWNAAVGSQMFVRTGNINEAKIKFTAGFLGALGPYFAQTTTPVNGVSTVNVNKSVLDPWVDPPFIRGFEARESILGHEFGHVLGIDHTDDNCNILRADAIGLAWRCSTSNPTWGDWKKVQNIYP